MTETTRRVGVRDVAKLAGVSTQTVSRVLNDFPGVREETREKVVAAVEALDYRFNNTARAFGTDTSRMIGVIASDATLHGPSLAVEAIEAAARAAGRWVSTAYADASDARSVTEAARHLAGLGVDGIVLVSALADTRSVLEGAGRALPVASLTDDEGSRRQSAAAALLAAHIRDHGHERIGVIAGADGWPESQARLAGVRSVIGDADANWRGDWTAASGAALAGDVARAVRERGVTAVIAANDQIALGLIAGLAGLGVRVPDDLSVTGFDDNPDAAYYLPALTTVRLDVAGEARRVIAAVLGDGAIAVAEPVLIVRSSTAPVG